MRTQATWMAGMAAAVIAVGSADASAADAKATTERTENTEKNVFSVGSVNSVAALPAAARRVVVSIPDRKLALIENDQVVSVYPVAVGASVSPSPVGTFTVISRVANPTYYKPGKVVAPGATNPVGTRWIGLNLKGYGIHGTDNPRSIGHAKSHGCIRLRNQDVEQLFERVRAGDVVELLGERTPEAVRLFGEVR